MALSPRARIDRSEDRQDELLAEAGGATSDEPDWGSHCSSCYGLHCYVEVGGERIGKWQEDS
jgi:hypothetical protein